MAAKVVKEMNEDFLVCSICMSQFKTPKMLPCIHSFCEGCLDKYAAKQEDKNQVPCPTCRKVCKLPETGVKGIQTNFHLVNLAERVSLLEKLTSTQKTVTACASCKSQEVVAFCTDCNFGICSKCEVHHALYPVLRGHDVIPLSKLNDPKFLQEWKNSKSPCCDLHPSEKLRFFCKTCSKLICRDCTIILHSKHECTEALIQFESSRGSLSQLVKQGNGFLQTGLAFVKKGENGLKVLQKSNHKLELEMDKRCKEIMKQIETSLHEQKQEMIEENFLKFTFVEEETQKAKEWVDRMKNTLEISSKLLKENNPWEVIAMSSNLSKAFDELRDESLTLNWRDSDLKQDVKFTPSETLPAFQLGFCGFRPDCVVSDNNGNFLLCKFDSKTNTFFILKKTHNNGDVQIYDPIKCDTDIPKSEEKLFACWGSGYQSLYFVFETRVAVIPNTYNQVKLHRVQLQGNATKIQYVSYNPQYGDQCVISNSLQNNMIRGNFTSNNQANSFQANQIYTLHASSPVTYIFPASYGVLYYTDKDELKICNWNNREYRQFPINPPSNIMGVAEKKVIHVVCGNGTCSKNLSGSIRTCNIFTVFTLYKGTATGHGDKAQDKAWVIKEYDTNAERELGILECLQGEPTAPMAMYNRADNNTGGMEMYLCHDTGNITKYKRGQFINAPVKYEKA